MQLIIGSNPATSSWHVDARMSTELSPSSFQGRSPLPPPPLQAGGYVGPSRPPEPALLQRHQQRPAKIGRTSLLKWTPEGTLSSLMTAIKSSPQYQQQQQQQRQQIHRRCFHHGNYYEHRRHSYVNQTPGAPLRGSWQVPGATAQLTMGSFQAHGSYSLAPMGPSLLLPAPPHPPQVPCITMAEDSIQYRTSDDNTPNREVRREVLMALTGAPPSKRRCMTRPRRPPPWARDCPR